MNSINQIRSFNYDKNQISNSNPHFDGNGRIVRKTMRNIDDIFCAKEPVSVANEFVQALRARKNTQSLAKKLDQLLNNKLDAESVNLVKKEIKETLLKEKIIDKTGNIINILGYKKIEIKRGTGWIPDDIKADYIIMKGGKVKTLTGKKVKVFKNARVSSTIDADEIIVHGGSFNTLKGVALKIFNAKKVLKAYAERILYIENSNVEKACSEGSISVFTQENSNIKSKVNYAEAFDLAVTGPSEIGYGNITNDTKVRGEGLVNKLDTENLDIYDGATVKNARVRNLTKIFGGAEVPGLKSRKVKNHRSFQDKVGKHFTGAKEFFASKRKAGKFFRLN